jgi:hypothetical protein
LGQQYALATLEAALPKRYQPQRRTTLDPLIRRAVEEGIFPAQVGSIDGRQPWLAKLRNYWAHGENSFPNCGALFVLANANKWDDEAALSSGRFTDKPLREEQRRRDPPVESW